MFELNRRDLLAAGAAGVGLSMLPRLAAADGCVFPPEGSIGYRVLREGDEIGQHIATFKRRGDDLIAINDIEIVVKMLGIPVYRYEHRSEEVWKKGWLTAVESTTNKDGKKKSLRGERRDEAMRLVVNGEKNRSVSGYVVTTSLWHRDTPFEQGLMDIEDGEVKLIKGQLVARETVPVGNGEVEARHYSVTGEMARELWYDDRCRLVRVEFNTKKDGSRIILEPMAET
ncbi:DUF6134 family protein [Ferruginivarius sediminum]|uniref:DUF3108 domain-containing protein n=1 Tax=Ferruginivarius sediminum TaxID=2661937 RepID=A0A369T626_9PROT|nr:DUF6134 family protein [Ferruginivarius sediminum]RDD60718.1 hypothetical protein DRB17_16795 [Ferruginivarius sediminum]